VPRIKTFAVSAHCRGRPGLHHETQKFETQVHARGNSCTILLTWSTIYIFSRFAHAKTHLNTFVPNCMDFSRSEIFQILGRIASVLRGSTPAILNLKVFIGTHYPARPFLRNPFLKPCVQTRNHASPSTVLISNFLVACAAQCWFVSRHIHFIMHIRSSNDDVISTTFIAYL